MCSSVDCNAAAVVLARGARALGLLTMLFGALPTVFGLLTETLGW